MIRAKVTDTTGYPITRTIRVIHYDAGCNYNDTDNDGVIDLLDQEDGTPPDSWVDRFGRRSCVAMSMATGSSRLLTLS